LYIHLPVAQNKFLAGVDHRSRAIFFMLGVLVFYCFWFWLLLALGLVSKQTTPHLVAFWLLLPLIPVGGFDLWMRITWRQVQATLYPPPPWLRPWIPAASFTCKPMLYTSPFNQNISATIVYF